MRPDGAPQCALLRHSVQRGGGAAFATLGLPAKPASKEALRFSAEIRRGAAVRIETRQESPLHLVHVLFDGEREAPSATLDAVYDGAEPGSPAGALLIEAYATVVYFDMVSRRPVPLPAGLREPSQGQA